MYLLDVGTKIATKCFYPTDLEAESLHIFYLK